MTSRAGRKRRAPDRAGADRPSALAPTGRTGPTGFTLLEVILSVGLLVMLAGIAIGVFWGTLSQASTQENANRITALLRSARAEAANTGLRYRLSFDEETSQPMLSVEADPLGVPGGFAACQAWWAEDARLQEGVRVLLCERLSETAFAQDSAGWPESEDRKDQVLSNVDFYPDGSSDSVRIVLGNDDEEHPWAAEITLNGVDGTIEAREIDLEEEPLE